MYLAQVLEYQVTQSDMCILSVPGTSVERWCKYDGIRQYQYGKLCHTTVRVCILHTHFRARSGSRTTTARQKLCIFLLCSFWPSSVVPSTNELFDSLCSSHPCLVSLLFVLRHDERLCESRRSSLFVRTSSSFQARNRKCFDATNAHRSRYA